MTTNLRNAVLVAGAIAAVAGCAGTGSSPEQSAAWDREAQEVMARSFRDQGIATVDRLKQDEVMAACSTHGQHIDDELRERIQAAAQADIKWPSDGNYLGDWKEGEKLAQSGRGMLEHSGYRTPTQINAHGFLTVNGEKMSKSRGTFITAQSYLDLGLNPEWLRYYFAAKLNGSMEDIDLNLDDFVARVNSDLVGKYINIASRCAGFISKRFGGALAAPTVPFHWHEASIREAYESRDYARALREVMACADQANVFVNDHAP